MTFLSVLAITIPVFLVVAVGYVTRRVKIVNDESGKSLLRLIINVLYPCFILSKVPGNEALQSSTVVLVALGAGLATLVVSFALTYGVGRLLGISPAQGLNTFSVSTAIQNYGYLPIPLIEGLFPETGDQILGVLFVHNLGLEIAIWTLGIVMISGTASGALRRLINGPTVAIAVGLFLNFSGLYLYLPGVLSTSIEMIGACAIPVSLLMVGATLGGVLEHERFTSDWRVMGGATLLRFLILPSVLLGVAFAVSSFPLLQRVLLVQAAMPTGIFPIVLAKHYGGHPHVAVQVAMTTSLLSLALTPLLLTLGVVLLG